MGEVGKWDSLGIGDRVDVDMGRWGGGLGNGIAWALGDRVDVDMGRWGGLGNGIAFWHWGIG